jgi:hypothetical protein
VAGDENLHVDPQQVSTYGLHMLLYSAQATMPLTTHLSNVEIDSSGAFSGVGAIGAGVFAEGPVMQAAMAKQSYAFNAFAGDLARGLAAIGNAADVCAYAYNGTDIEAAEKMNLLGYAFATDPAAKAPKGLPKGTGKTMVDQELSGDGGAGGPDALTDPDSGTTVQIYGRGQLTYYGDGSTRMVQTQDVPGDSTASRAITTITGPGGAVLSTTTTEARYSAAGTSSEYYRQVVTPGQKVAVAGGKPVKTDDVTVTTKTSGTHDGGRTIETTTQTGDAKPTVSKVYVAPTPSTPDVSSDGPLEQAQDVLGPDAGRVDWRKGYQGVEASS